MRAAACPRVVWPAEHLWAVLEPRWPGFTVEVLAEVDSTNAELMRRARSGAAAPTLLIAERQTQGRGRLGRVWHVHDPVAALTFSLLLPLAPQDWSGLSLAVGLSLATSLHPQVGVKWPNDLWWQDRKLGGILIETVVQGAQPQAPRPVVVGVGLNLQPPALPDVSPPPAGLQELDAGLDAPTLLLRTVPSLVQALLQFEKTGFPTLQAAYAQRDVLRGRDVALSDGRSGRALGVQADGALAVQTAEGTVRVVHDEVSVRPRVPSVPHSASTPPNPGS